MIKRITNQAFPFETLNTVPLLKENAQQFISSLSNGDLAVFNYVILIHATCPWVYPSHERIALETGLSRGHVCRIIGKLKELGLIITNYRHKKSSEYKISNYFRSFFNRYRFKHLLPALGLIPVFWWVSEAPARLPYQIPPLKNVTQIDKELFYITSSSKSSSSFASLTSYRQLTRKEDYQSTKKIVKEAEKERILEINEAIASVKAFKLTRAGEIKLTIFPPEALIYANGKMGYTNSLRDPFAWYFKLCGEYCSTHDIPLKWKAMYDLAKAEKVTLAYPYIQSPGSQQEGNKKDSDLKRESSRKFQGHKPVYGGRMEAKHPEAPLPDVDPAKLKALFRAASVHILEDLLQKSIIDPGLYKTMALFPNFKDHAIIQEVLVEYAKSKYAKHDEKGSHE